MLRQFLIPVSLAFAFSANAETIFLRLPIDVGSNYEGGSWDFDRPPTPDYSASHYSGSALGYEDYSDSSWGIRSYHSYYLTDIPGTVTGAALDIQFASSDSQASILTVGFYDVSTPVEYLHNIATYTYESQEINIHVDLGTGTTYGSLDVAIPQKYNYEFGVGEGGGEVTLNAAAVDAINASLGGWFSIGSSLAQHSGFDNLYYARPVELILTVEVADPADPLDVDGDSIPDATDNCVNYYNPDQLDMDGDSIGDLCDPYPSDTDNLGACLVDVGTLEQSIVELSDGNASLQSEIDSLNAENTSLNAEIDSLNAEIDNLNAENTSLNAEIDSLNAENTSLNAEIDSLNAENTSLNAEIDALRSIDRDGDGVPDVDDLCPGTRENLRKGVDADGCRL